jgi:DamX protein
VFKSLRQGKDWFVVVIGHYPSSARARQAIDSLPELQKKASPWPRDLKTIKKEIIGN